MGFVVVKAKRVVAAAPASVYLFLVDFRNNHHRILPPNFSEYRVEAGGTGTGTIITYHFKVGRRERDYRMSVDADEVAPRIVERDQASSLTTTWDFVPHNGGARTSVEITTAWKGASGVGGFFERTFAPLALRRIYRQQLASLATAL